MSSKAESASFRYTPRLPHPSWNLDKPMLFMPQDGGAAQARVGDRRIVTPDDIWAAVDAAS